MRILFLLSYFYPYKGGAEHLFLRLTGGLASKGHTIKVITTRLPGTPSCEELHGVQIQRIQVPPIGDRFFYTFLGFPAAISQVRDYDIVHTTWYNNAIVAYIASRIGRRPIVYTSLEVAGDRWSLLEPNPVKSWAFRALEKFAAELPYDRYVAISQATYRDSLRVGVDPRRASVIYCGVDELFSSGTVSPDGSLRALCGANTDDFLYVYFGRPGISKGVEVLLKAVPDIHRDIPCARLALILMNEPRSQYLRIRHLVDELGAESRVHLIPPADDRGQLARYLLDASCVVVPSLTEGFGFTTAETCALGIPVVATCAGSIPEVVSGDHVLVEAGSSSALARGVVRAWSGQYDHLPQKKFTWATTVNKYEELYQELIGSCT